MSADPPSVSLREYLEALIGKETGVIMARLNGMDERHTVQADELARRLEELNHAHARSLEDKGTYLPREVFEQTQREVRTRMELVDAKLAEERGASAATTRIWSVATSLFVGLAVLLIGYFLNKH